jgi:hypothetical protein
MKAQVGCRKMKGKKTLDGKSMHLGKGNRPISESNQLVKVNK